MRESHAIGLLTLPDSDPHAGEYAITAGVLGIQVWDIASVDTPEMINYLEIEGVFYPDAYTRVVLSVFLATPVALCGCLPTMASSFLNTEIQENPNWYISMSLMCPSEPQESLPSETSFW